MEQPKILISGWCINCTCRPHFHVGDEDGDCRNCKCRGFVLDNYRDALDKRNLEYITSRLNESDLEPEEPEEFEVEEIEEDDRTVDIFLGEASRGCGYCGEVKLYKDFNNSHDPKTICNYCAWEQNDFNTLDDTVSDTERKELLDIEDDILENELAYYEAIERQEILDEVLRGLDE